MGTKGGGCFPKPPAAKVGRGALGEAPRGEMPPLWGPH